MEIEEGRNQVDAWREALRQYLIFNFHHIESQLHKNEGKLYIPEEVWNCLDSLYSEIFIDLLAFSDIYSEGEKLQAARQLGVEPEYLEWPPIRFADDDDEITIGECSDGTWMIGLTLFFDPGTPIPDGLTEDTKQQLTTIDALVERGIRDIKTNQPLTREQLFPFTWAPISPGLVRAWGDMLRLGLGSILEATLYRLHDGFMLELTLLYLESGQRERWKMPL